jgi:hypothetical protein
MERSRASASSCCNLCKCTKNRCVWYYVLRTTVKSAFLCPCSLFFSCRPVEKMRILKLKAAFRCLLTELIVYRRFAHFRNQTKDTFFRKWRDVVHLGKRARVLAKNAQKVWMESSLGHVVVRHLRADFFFTWKFVVTEMERVRRSRALLANYGRLWVKGTVGGCFALWHATTREEEVVEEAPKAILLTAVPVSTIACKRWKGPCSCVEKFCIHRSSKSQNKKKMYKCSVESHVEKRIQGICFHFS